MKAHAVCSASQPRPIGGSVQQANHWLPYLKPITIMRGRVFSMGPISPSTGFPLDVTLDGDEKDPRRSNGGLRDVPVSTAALFGLYCIVR